ncbi:MAG: DNA internalization-related competence protein ComEC/Rec2, partial [Gammaproteobacteria bacterium]
MKGLLRSRPGMPAYAACLLSGTVVLQLCSSLPDSMWLAFLPLSLLIPVFQGVARLMLIMATGLLLALLHAHLYANRVLPESLAGQDFLLQGVVADIPIYDGRVQRFEFEVQHYIPQVVENVPQRLRVSWYHAEHKMRAGEVWQLKLRLKPPHGNLNPGGFDYERWLYQHDIHATAYVRDSRENQRLAHLETGFINQLRQRLFEQIDREDARSGVLAALAVGYKGAVSADDWNLLRITGTNHLMAISGLHIGLVAAMTFGLVRRFTPAWVIRQVAVQRLASILALMMAVFYAALAGFSVPTQRALIMLAVVLVAIIVGRQIRPLTGLSLALLVVLVMDPLAVLSPGFWFSFIAVAVIVYAFHGRIGQHRKLMQWSRLQWTLALFLFPLTLFLFQQASLVAPLANLILVPWVSFLVVPPLLLALPLFWIWPMAGDISLQLASMALDIIWPFMQTLGNLPLASWQQASPSLPALLLALIGTALVLAPTGLPVRWLGTFCLLPVFIQKPALPLPGDYQMTLLDVGQGLSVFVQTHGHSLLFDTGARIDDDFDLGDRVVVPFLRHKGIVALDTLVVSHGDNDHIGGARSIIRQLHVKHLLGQDIVHLEHDNKQLCTSGLSWEWDGVEFEILHPDRAYQQRNHRACVLKIRGAGGSVLIASDIERPIEYHLLQTQSDKLAADVLVVPHHGSKTSSTSAWLQAVRPTYALISAGYRNRFHHPHASVVARYQRMDVALLNTANSGAIGLYISQYNGVSQPVLQRE